MTAVSAASQVLQINAASNTSDSAAPSNASDQSFASVLQTKQAQPSNNDAGKTTAPPSAGNDAKPANVASNGDTKQVSTGDAKTSSDNTKTTAPANGTSASQASSDPTTSPQASDTALTVLTLLSAAKNNTNAAATTVQTLDPIPAAENKTNKTLKSASEKSDEDSFVDAQAATQLALSAMQTVQDAAPKGQGNSDTTADSSGSDGKPEYAIGTSAANVAADKTASEPLHVEQTSTPKTDASNLAATTTHTEQSNAGSFAAALNSAQANGNIKADTAQTTNRTSEMPVTSRVGTHEWNQEVGDRISWMANNQESHAQLVLHPPELGRIEVSLKISGTEASAVFNSGNAQVRNALETALPRLREVLADAGVSLGQTHVGSGSSQQQTSDNPNSRQGSGTNSAIFGHSDSNAPLLGGSSTLSLSSRFGRAGNGLVDTFA